MDSHDSHYNFILRGTERRVKFFLDRQILEDGPYKGTSPGQMQRAYAAARPTASTLSAAIVCYANPDSVYYPGKRKDGAAGKNIGRTPGELPPDGLLMERMLLAEQGIRNNLRPSGCLDLENCNFDTAPDTAFAVLELIPAYKVLKQSGIPEASPLLERLYDLIRLMTEGIYSGGFHTPNHRWVIASALATCANLFNEESALSTAPASAPERYRQRALDYLREGVDCNKDGEYSERSAGGYNVVNNRAMLVLARELNEPKYLEYVRRNLHMMLCYLEPDGSIFTQNSTRQDKGQKAWAGGYYIAMRHMAEHYNDEILAAASNQVMEDCMALGLQAAPEGLADMILHPSFRTALPNPPAYPQKFDRHFEASGVARYRNGNFGYALVRDSSRFFFFQSGGIGFYLRLSAGYFEKRHVKIEKIIPTENGYRFTFHGDGWYYLPFKQVDEDIVDFFKADNGRREKLIANTTDLSVEIINAENGVDVRFKSEGIDRVCYLLEIVLPSGLPAETEAVYTVPAPGESLLVKSGTLTVKDYENEISIGPMRGDRIVTEGNHGSDPRDTEGFTVYNTFVTNFDHVLKIRSK